MNENLIERIRERIFTKGEVMEIISRFVENPTLTRELSDNDGLYLLEAEVPGKEPGETIEYQYMRKGRFGKNQSTETSLYVAYYQDGMPIGGEKVAFYDSELNQWKS